MLGESSRLSLTPSGSSTKAVFGALSAPVLLVTQSGADPVAFAAVQPAGSAGAETASKLCESAVVTGPSTVVSAEPCPVPPSVDVNEAVFVNDEPQLAAAVGLTTCTCVAEPPASVERL
jgi:hypothetical protein